MLNMVRSSYRDLKMYISNLRDDEVVMGSVDLRNLLDAVFKWYILQHDCNFNFNGNYNLPYLYQNAISVNNSIGACMPVELVQSLGRIDLWRSYNFNGSTLSSFCDSSDYMINGYELRCLFNYVLVFLDNMYNSGILPNLNFSY